MNFTLVGLLVYLIVAGICGAIGRAIGGGTRGGIFVSIALGFVGAMLGVWASGALHLPEIWMIRVEGHPFPIVWSIIGAALFVALIHLVSRIGDRGRARV
ncbi:MAG: GlsB/YeaQ/YmgE family stress response membrane protein [Polyangiaceae bacterium]